MKLTTILSAIPVIGPVLAAVPEVKALFDEAVGALHPHDQATAKQALADLIAENDAGHERLQDKLHRAGT